MTWFRRVLRIEVFDETREHFAGPRWAWALAMAAATVAYLCVVAVIVALAGGFQVLPWCLGFVAAFALSSGALFHLGAKARAANQLVICALGLAVLWLAV